MSGDRTLRFVNTLAAEGNNELVLVNRSDIITPTPIPGPIGVENVVESSLLLSTTGLISVSDPNNGERNIRESLALLTAGNLTGLTGLTVNGAINILDGTTGLFINDINNTFTQQICMGANGANIKWTLPISQGGAGEVLSNDGAGVLSWIAAGGGGSGDVSSNIATSTINRAAVFADGTGKLITEDSSVLIDSGNISGVETLLINHLADESDDHALEINMSAAGFSDVRAIDLHLTTGTIASGFNYAGLLVNIDKSASTGGRIFALAALSTSGTAETDVIACGVDTNPIIQQSGVFINATTILNIAVDVTADLSLPGGGGDITLFAADNDTVTIQGASTFSEIQFILDIFASGPGIDPVFEFSDGAGPTTWAVFNPLDGTNQFRSSGVISWELSDVASWVIGDSGNFEIRITRTRNTVSPPRCDTCQTSNVILFEWNKDGDLTINNIISNELTASGKVDFNTVPNFDVLTNDNTLSACRIRTQGGTSTELHLENITGTSASSVRIDSLLGGINMDAETDINVDSVNGRIDLRAVANTSSNAVQLDASLGGITLTTANGVTVVDADLGGIILDDSTSAFNTTVKCSGLSSESYDIVLPPAQASGTQVLTNNGSGVCSWATNASTNIFPTGHIFNLIVSDNSDTIKNISSGSCRDVDDTVDMVFAGGVANIGLSGLGGLDTGVITGNTWYSLWIISIDGASTNTLISLSATTPVFPAGGYNKKRRVGWARMDGSSDFYKYDTTDTGRDRVFLWNEEETILELLTNGSATSYTNVNLAELIPPTSTLGYLNSNHISEDGAQEFLTLRTAGIDASTSPITNPRAHRCFGSSANASEASGSTCFWIRTDATQNIEYANSSGSEESDVWVLGYKDSL